MNKSLLNLNYNHPYHLVTQSPWPILTSINLMIMLIGAIKWFNEFNYNLILIGFMTLNLCSSQWWRDVIRESTFQGFHTLKVSKLMRMGMILFICSEIFFFLSFFWAYFHMSLSPSIEIGSMWPPILIQPFNPYNIPLLNTIILLSSGVSITWSHYSILNSNLKESLISMNLTILLGVYFTSLQYMEYNEASFCISDSVYGSTFFMITGFHGLHVIIGTIFIIVTMMRLKKFHFSCHHHFGFEASSWYWHFVDVVWLFVYISIYWWTY
uniref:cytochrome c oxidase subunit III n=1 Tax=Gotra octocincta TaxID=3029099 RepID=UPI0023D8809C|nr:cytochrome c oxidase subunit III [Gotra octocincta]WDQ40356.1 cytochrome c oxidase subunit 3 [Gotra octocincta]